MTLSNEVLKVWAALSYPIICLKPYECTHAECQRTICATALLQRNRELLAEREKHQALVGAVRRCDIRAIRLALDAEPVESATAEGETPQDKARRELEERHQKRMVRLNEIVGEVSQETCCTCPEFEAPQPERTSGHLYECGVHKETMRVYRTTAEPLSDAQEKEMQERYTPQQAKARRLSLVEKKRGAE